IADRVFVIKPLDAVITRPGGGVPATSQTALSNLVVPAGGSVADVAEQASRAVVTVAVKTERPVLDASIFGQLGIPRTTETELVQQDIGTGFVVDAQGLIVTNKHVVGNPNAEYLVIDANDQEYSVVNI